SFDPIPRTPEESEEESNDEEDQDLRLSEKARIQEEEDADELYRDVNINQGRGLQVTQNVEDTHVTLTPVNPDGLQESSSMSSEAPIPPPTIPSIILENLLMFNSTFRFEERLRPLEKSFSKYRQTNPFADAVSAIPNSDEDDDEDDDDDDDKEETAKDDKETKETGTRGDEVRERGGESEEEKETSEDEEVSFDPIPRTPEEIEKESDDDEEQESRLHQLQDSLQQENDEFLRNIDENMKNVLKGLVKTQVKEQVSRILPRVEESVNATLEAEVLTRSSHFSRTSYAVAADLSEMELKKILIEKIEGNKRIYKRTQSRQQSASESAHAEEPVQTTCQMKETLLLVYKTGADEQPIVQTSQHPEWFSQPRKPPSPDRAWNTALPAAQGDAQSWISELAKQADARSSFNELLDTPIDFSNFIMHRLNVDTLTPDLLAGLTYELMKGSCSSLTELEYHLEEVCKATTDQLDWVNPEGQHFMGMRLTGSLLEMYTSAGSNRGSKRQKEGGEHASASTPSKTVTGSAGKSTTGSQSRQLSANESAFAEEPVQTT
nr:hypothetical protein [Tanacetum cinerariifolium]